MSRFRIRPLLVLVLKGLSDTGSSGYPKLLDRRKRQPKNVVALNPYYLRCSLHTADAVFRRSCLELPGYFSPCALDLHLYKIPPDKDEHSLHGTLRLWHTPSSICAYINSVGFYPQLQKFFAPLSLQKLHSPSKQKHCC